MTSDFVVWEHDRPAGALYLADVVGYGAINTLVNGTSLAKQWPKNVRLVASTDRSPHGPAGAHAKLPPAQLALDAVANQLRILVASGKLTELLRRAPACELLPPVDCLDIERSGPTYSKIAKQQISKVGWAAFRVTTCAARVSHAPHRGDASGATQMT